MLILFNESALYAQVDALQHLTISTLQVVECLSEEVADLATVIRIHLTKMTTMTWMETGMERAGLLVVSGGVSSAFLEKVGGRNLRSILYSQRSFGSEPR